MSRYGLLMGDFEDDPFFGAHMQRMNNMMSSMFGDPFAMMGGPPSIMAGQNQNNQLHMPGMQMMPFGFPPMGMNINRMFSDLQNMSNNPNCHSFSSSSMMTMTTGPDGRPQVYQESMSSRTGPEGVKETKKTVSDSRTGTRKMAIGHHIGDRAHIIEREKNEYTGDQEERQDYINLDEEEAESFNQEWQSKARRSIGAIGSGPYRSPYDRAQQFTPLALPSTAPRSAERISNNASPSSLPLKAAPSFESPENLSINNNNNNNNNNTNTNINNNNRSSSSSSSNSSSSSSSSSSSNQTSSRKREHSPDIEEIEEVEEIKIEEIRNLDNSHKRRSHGTTSDD